MLVVLALIDRDAIVAMAFFQCHAEVASFDFEFLEFLIGARATIHRLLALQYIVLLVAHFLQTERVVAVAVAIAAVAIVAVVVLVDAVVVATATAVVAVDQLFVADIAVHKCDCLVVHFDLESIHLVEIVVVVENVVFLK